MQNRFNFLDEQECNEIAHNNVMSSQQMTQQIAKGWLRYATLNKLKHNTEKRRQAQHTFIAGVASVMQTEVPMLISLCMVSGRDLESIIERG